MTTTDPIGIRRLVRFLRNKLSRIMTGESIQDTFVRIYRGNYWGNSDSRSGAGSDLTQTAEIRARLPELIEKFSINSMLDIPCGDWHWMKEVQLNINYIGADIVPDIINMNAEQYGNKTRRFIMLDMTKDALPKADLVFSRDVLVHMSFEHVYAALRNISASETTYLLTTTYTDREENFDIVTGLWRPLNLTAAPFNFPEPIALINEKCTEGDGRSWGDKCLGLWNVKDLYAVLNRTHRS